jgi:hypothetical protein
MGVMPLWGIVLLGLAAWVLISIVLGVLIGRAVRVADARRSDQEFVRQLSRRAVPAPRASARAAEAATLPVPAVDRPAAPRLLAR